MAIAAAFRHPPLPLSPTPRHTPSPLNAHRCRLPSAPLLLLLRLPAAAPRVATVTPRAARDDDRALPDPPERRRQSTLDVASLLSAATATVAAVAAAAPLAALAASGGSMGGCSSDSSSSWSSSSSSSYSSSSSSYDDTSSSTWWSSSSPSSSSSRKAETSDATHVSVGTPAAELPPEVKRLRDMVYWGTIALLSAGVAALLFLPLRSDSPPSKTVIKLQVALRGVAAAKSFQKDLNEIAEKVKASNRRWYKFILTETIRSLGRHKDSCFSSSLSVDHVGSWRKHFNEISIEERSKFDEETFSNLDGIKRKKSYSKKTDGSRNEYIVLTILIAADGALKFPEVRSTADLEAVVQKLNSIRTEEIQGIHVLWTPQEENDVLSEEELREDYPYLKPLDP